MNAVWEGKKHSNIQTCHFVLFSQGTGFSRFLKPWALF